jgi:rubrerythrin
MMAVAIPERLEQQILLYQRNEITEYHIYRRLAQRVLSVDNRRVLESIAADDWLHVWREADGAG